LAQNTEANKQFLEAAKAGNIEEVEKWISKGADVNCKDSLGISALHYAARVAKLEIAGLLLNKGAKTDILDASSKTPLMYAAYNGNLRICHLLYISGANLSIEDEDGFSAKNYAQTKGFLRVFEFLINPKSYNKEPTCNELLITAYHYYKKENYPEAILYGQMAKDKAEIELTSNHIYKATIYNFLGVAYSNTGKNLLAEPLYIQALGIRKAVLGEKDPLYATSLCNLAGLYESIGNYAKAETLYLESKKIRAEVLGLNHPEYTSSLIGLAGLYKNMGFNLRSKAIYEEVRKIQQLALGEVNIEYATTLNNIAELYRSLSEFQKAEPFYLESINIIEDKLGKENSSYVSILNNMGLLYANMGDYQKAEQLYLESIKIQKKINGINHLLYDASTLNNLAELYRSLGNIQKAKSLYLEAIRIQKSNMGEKNPDYLITLNNLALCYENTEEYQKAEQILIHIMNIRLAITGKNNPDYASTLHNLAGIYNSIGNYTKAELLYNESLELWRNLHGENDLSFSFALNNLAGLNRSIGNYQKAEVLYQQSIKIRKKVFGDKHHIYISSLNGLAWLYVIMGEYLKSEPLNLYICENNKKDLNLKFNFLSENERLLYWGKFKSLFNLYPSFVYSYYPQKPSISTFAYDNALFTKSLLLNTSLQIQNAVLQSGDIALINTWENLRGLKRMINVLQSKPLAQQGDLAIMEAQADSLDKVLTQKSQLYKHSQEDMQVKWTDVQKNLKPNEAAIEFISFNYFNKHYTDSTLYCALVLKKDSKYPEMIALFEEKQLDSLFVKSVTDVNQLYNYRLTNLRKEMVESTLNYGSNLYNLIWKPLEASLKDIKTVYYAPSGKLNQVSFAAIPVDSTVLLSDKYNLHQVTSTRQVIKNSNAANKLQEAALFGGIKYELDDKQLAQVQTAYTTTNYRSVFVSDSTQRSNTFTYLKGTDDEVKGIANEFSKKGLTDQLYTGAVASEAAFKKLNGTNTDIIHIATHGFYLPVEVTKREEFRFMGFDNERRNVVVKNPLLRSGLVMAGANRAWRGDSIPENWEDGILTAHEISQINLTNTELVVLSACETGLGDNGGSEGVFGLQRAFKMAGVQTLIMSLWKVPDTQTSQLMQSFYKYWLGGMTKHDAFKKAQNEVRTANPNPYYWAAFVMVD